MFRKTPKCSYFLSINGAGRCRRPQPGAGVQGVRRDLARARRRGRGPPHLPAPREGGAPTPGSGRPQTSRPSRLTVSAGASIVPGSRPGSWPSTHDPGGGCPACTWGSGVFGDCLFHEGFPCLCPPCDLEPADGSEGLIAGGDHRRDPQGGRPHRPSARGPTGPVRKEVERCYGFWPGHLLPEAATTCFLGHRLAGPQGRCGL